MTGRLGQLGRYPAQATLLQFSLRNLFHLTAVLSLALAVELTIGVFARLSHVIPFEATFLVFPICAMASVVFFFLPARSPQIVPDVDRSRRISWWVAIYFAAISLAIAVSLFLRYESGGPISGMANGINLMNTSTLLTFTGSATLIILWLRRSPHGAMRLVFGIVLFFVLPTAWMIATE